MTTTMKDEDMNNSGYKCGEVFVTEKGIFSCFCIFCNQNFPEIKNFTGHIIDTHLGSTSSETECLFNFVKSFDCVDRLNLSTENNFSYFQQDEIENFSSEFKSFKSTLFNEINISDPLISESLDKSGKQLEKTEFSEEEENFNSDDSDKNSNYNEDVKFELPLFRCDVCNRSFKKKSALVSHKKRHENVMPNCKHCGKYFRHKSSFNSHNQTLCGQRMKQGQKLKSELPDIKCKYCEKIFKKTAFLKKHEELHEDSPYKCNYCYKKFMAKHLMEDHIRTHTGEKPFKCEYCPVAFANQTNLKRHILIHVGERSFVCTIGCGKAFYTERERAGHERSHTGEKPFVCELCGRYFAFQHQLSLHKKRFHMDKKNWPHKCDQCDKAFIAPKHLREHIVVHTGEKPFACDQCPGRFSKYSGLREHRKLHSGVKNHICTICNKAFAQTAGLYSHMKSHGVIKETTDLINEILDK